MANPLTVRAVIAIAALACAGPALSAAFPNTPLSRPVPAAGMSQEDVLAEYGRPTNGIVTQQIGDASFTVWDFSTFRVYLKSGRVVESRRW